MRFNQITYIHSKRLNQNILEDLFSYLRAMGHTFDSPGRLEFINRLKKYILGKHSAAVFSVHKNTEDYVNTDNMSIEILNKNKKNLIRTTSEEENNNEREIVLTQSLFNAILRTIKN